MARALALCLALGPSPVSLAAQDWTPGTVSVAGGATLGLLVGDDTDFLDGGLGPWAAVRWQSGSSMLGLAGSITWLPLDRDTDGLTGARADNALFTILVGPTLEAEVGPVRPWASVLIGVAAVRSTQETATRSVHETTASLAWRTGAGLAVPLGGAIALEAEAGLTGTGGLSFARAPAPDSQAPTGLLERDVTLLSLRIGVEIGL